MPVHKFQECQIYGFLLIRPGKLYRISLRHSRITDLSFRRVFRIDGVSFLSTLLPLLNYIRYNIPYIFAILFQNISTGNTGISYRFPAKSRVLFDETLLPGIASYP